MYSYARNLTALFGTMRTQLAPLPLNMPATPSFLAMWKRPWQGGLGAAHAVAGSHAHTNVKHA
eukprot:311633-Chlamydomonas_euryale.AAC.13